MNNRYKDLYQQFDRIRRHSNLGSYKTRERYCEAFKRFLYFLAGEYELQKLTNIHPKHMEAYVNYMQSKGLAASTIKTDLAAIRFWHDQIPNARNNLPANDELNLERRKFGGVDRTWSEDEFNSMIALCKRLGKSDYAASISIARYAGLRIHEVFRIDTAIARKAVKTGFLTIKGKGGKVRDVKVDGRVEVVFREYLAITELGHKLFVPTGKATHIAITELQNFITRHRDEVQDEDNPVPLTFHGLRHTYAAEQYETHRAAGKSVLDAKQRVSQSIGHNRPDVTDIYLAGISKKKRDGGAGDV